MYGPIPAAASRVHDKFVIVARVALWSDEG